MSPSPAGAAITPQHAQIESDAEPEQPLADRTPGPKEQDDGSVPERQISRWKGEGGALRPAD